MRCFSCSPRLPFAKSPPDYPGRQAAISSLVHQPVIARRSVTPEEALRYAMSLPVSITNSGIDSLTVLRQNLAVALGFKPLTPEQLEDLRSLCSRWPPGTLQDHQALRRQDWPGTAWLSAFGRYAS